MLCPRCQEPLASGQEYCLECGARIDDGRRRRGQSLLGSGWALRALVAAAVALAGGAAAIAATGGGSGGQNIVTAIGGFATTPTTTTDSSSQGALGAADWPTGQDGWTVALAALPQTEGRKPALARARVARARKLPQVGILDSSRYASLHPGYWIVFSGVYASEAEATSALDDARRVSRTAAVRRVIP
jgi:hypothetical protein